jgi:uncharacterized membrane protein
MPFCANCGSQTEGRFCAKCGAPVGAPAGPATGAPASGVPPVGNPMPMSSAPPPATAGMAQNVAAALCYVLGLITGILFLVLEPYSRDRVVRFHAFQSIFLNLAYFVLWIVVSIFMGILFHIGGWFLSAIIWPLFLLFWLGVWLYMILSAYQGKTVMLPFIGQLAQQQAQTVRA